MQSFPYDYSRADAASTDLILAALPYAAGSLIGAAIVLILFACHNAANSTTRHLNTLRHIRRREQIKRAQARSVRRLRQYN